MGMAWSIHLLVGRSYWETIRRPITEVNHMRLRNWHRVYLMMAVPVALVGAASALVDRFDQIAFGTVPWPFVLFAITGAWTTQVSSLGRGDVCEYLCDTNSRFPTKKGATSPPARSPLLVGHACAPI